MTNRIYALALSGLLTLSLPAAVNAGYNSNIQGKITNIRIYNDGRMFIKLDNMPATHPVCNVSYFAIDPTLSSDIRAQMLSRLFIAKSSGETINIGYDYLDNCASGYIQAFEVGQ